MLMPKNVYNIFEQMADYWSPVLVETIDHYAIKAAKFKGEFPWHAHTNGDECFFVIKGRVVLRFREGSVALDEGEMYTVKKGVEHSPLAIEEAWVLLIESATTRQYGDLPKC